jgi:hypothetical protein
MSLTDKNWTGAQDESINRKRERRGIIARARCAEIEEMDKIM